MIVDIFDQITGENRPSLLCQQEFSSLDELYGAYSRTDSPTLLIVTPDALPEALTWLEEGDDICVTTDPESLVEHRLQALAVPDSSQFDPVTGLLSRGAFDTALSYASQDETLTTLSLIICRMDQLRELNNAVGRDKADTILAAIGELLRSASADGDLLARFSPKEFAIFSSRCRTSATMLAQRISEIIEERFANEPFVSMSIGIATELKADWRDLATNADTALRAARASDSNRSFHYQQLVADDVETIADRNAHRSPLACDNATRDIDELTQLYNRGYLDRRLAREVKDSEVPLCVAFVDVDSFRDINRQFGWPTGDKVLQDVGELIRRQLRGCDWVGRYGCQDFCIVMQNTTLAQSFPILERLRLAVQEHEFRSTHDQPFTATISAGAVESSTDEGPQQLLQRAGSRARAAKKQGRNRVLI